jgi:hypothetical protein
MILPSFFGDVKNMNGRVIFLPLVFMPTEEEMEILSKMQENIHYARISFLQTISRESPFQKRIAHQNYRNLVKECIRYNTQVITSFYSQSEEE